MISVEAQRVIQEIDNLAEERFGENYTLTIRKWNNGDFRVIAYRTIDPEKVDIDEDACYIYEEFFYQDTKIEDDKLLHCFMVQHDEGPRTATEQEKKYAKTIDREKEAIKQLQP